MSDLENRMKMYELQEAARKTLPLLPVMARLDGKCFHSWTKNLQRPFDENFHRSMLDTTFALVEETNAVLGYTQSDEISLMWYSDDPQSQIFFNGRLQKINSVLASMCTYHFNRNTAKYLPDQTKPALFDCRVWQVPNLTEAANVFVWRWQDAMRNSKMMLGQSVFSHKELQFQSADVVVLMLKNKGVLWDELENWKKYGTFVRRFKTETQFSADEIEKLPPNHEARKNPNLTVMRSKVDILNVSCLNTVPDKVACLFGA